MSCRRTSIGIQLPAVFLAILAPWASPALAESALTVPDACQESAHSTVALLDCLQTQQELMRHILDYETLLQQAQEMRQQRTEPAPPHTDQVTTAAETDAWNQVMERVNWFDRNLEVYAIVGTGDSRTAHARLEGREYRLRLGDQLRLATVVRIDPRTLYLSIPGAEFPVSLSGSGGPLTKSPVDSQ